MKKIKVHIKSLVLLCFLMILFAAEIFKNQFQLLKCFDEVLAVCCLLYLVISSLKHSLKLHKMIYIIILCCIGIFSVGFVSNMVFHLQNDMIVIFLDVVANFKLIIICIAFNQVLNTTISKELIQILKVPSEVLLFTGFVCGIISQIFDIGMRGQERYGIWGFNFIFEQAHIYSMITIFCMIIVVMNSRDIRYYQLYVIIGVIQLLFTLKGISFVSVAALLLITICMKIYKKIKFRTMVIIGVIASCMGLYQIQNYILNTSAPRSLIIRYGIKTAIDYFPLGSGFATYGSDMAAKNYSVLYKQYKFNMRYGMSSGDTSFLNDNYWPMIMGQFGIFGLILMLVVFIIFFRIIQKSQLDINKKIIVLFGFSYIVVASLGTSIIIASTTIILMTGIILVLNMSTNA